MQHNNQKSFTRINQQIRCPSVRVKKDEEHLGIMSIQQALDIAWQEGLDLVEIVPNTNPPICAIMDYSKFKFDEKKKRKEQQSKSKNVAPKEIRLRPVSGDHDVETKIKQLKQFLEEKHPVSVNIVFKNRELGVNRDQGWEIMKKIIAAVEDVGTKQDEPRFVGKSINVRLVPKSH